MNTDLWDYVVFLYSTQRQLKVVVTKVKELA